MIRSFRAVLNILLVLGLQAVAGAAEQDPLVRAAVEEERYVLVEFTSQTCPACDEMRPIVGNVLSQHPKVMYREVDADLKPRLAKRYDVKCVPVYVIVDPNGSILFNEVGMRSEEEMADILRKAGALGD